MRWERVTCTENLVEKFPTVWGKCHKTSGYFYSTRPVGLYPFSRQRGWGGVKKIQCSFSLKITK